MANEVDIIPPRPKSIVRDMADRYGMEEEHFDITLRATVFPANGSDGALAAFLIVCKQYDLNPVLKEIYAYVDKRTGAIVPIVSIDGWMHLINAHPAFDGMEFRELVDENDQLVATTCSIYRKDRSRPIVVTEHLSECYRNTDPWKMKHRMLRHKAAIQCARYAFGFAGIFDEDEGERFAAPPAPASQAQQSSHLRLVEQQQSESPRQTQEQSQPQAKPFMGAKQKVPPIPPGPKAPPAPPPVQEPDSDEQPQDDSRAFESELVRKLAEAAEQATANFDPSILEIGWSMIVSPHEASMPRELYEQLRGIFDEGMEKLS